MVTRLRLQGVCRRSRRQVVPWGTVAAAAAAAAEPVATVSSLVCPAVVDAVRGAAAAAGEDVNSLVLGLAPAVRRRLGVVASVAATMTVSDDVLDAVCAEAIRRVVFLAVGSAIMDLYGPLHADRDAELDVAADRLWGITCTQVRCPATVHVCVCLSVSVCVLYRKWGRAHQRVRMGWTRVVSWQLKIDKPVCIDAVPLVAGVVRPPTTWPPLWCRPYQRAVNVFSELSRSPSPDAKRDVMISTMGVVFRCVQVCAAGIGGWSLCTRTVWILDLRWGCFVVCPGVLRGVEPRGAPALRTRGRCRRSWQDETEHHRWCR